MNITLEQLVDALDHEVRLDSDLALIEHGPEVL